MVDQVAASPSNKALPTPAKSPEKSGGFGFHDILSALNPLQYIPVVGTVYRSATGDTIPENTRMVGSMVVSFLTGGPIGVATSAAASVLEKATGFDPEKIGHSLLAKMGIGHADQSAPIMEAHAQTQMKPNAVPASKEAATSKIVVDTAAITPNQLAAYGVHNAANGEIEMGSLTGSDVLNSIELHQLAMQSQGDFAASAYSAVMRPNEAGHQHNQTA